MAGNGQRESARLTADQPRSGQVLVIDDEADIRELLELSLVRMGCRESFGSVADAKHLLQSKH